MHSGAGTRSKGARGFPVGLQAREVLHEKRAETVPMHRGMLLATRKAKQACKGSVMNLLDAAPSSSDVYRAPDGYEFRLRSHFQPIFSLAHRRPVGYEG